MSVKCSEVVNFNICLGYYRFISLMFEEEIKYIRNYKIILNDYFKKVLNLQVTLGSKLGQPPEEFSNADWLDFKPILKLSQYIPKMIQKQIENIKYFIDESDKSIKTIDDFLKEKSNVIKKYQQKYEESSNDLIKKYIDVEKAKISFLNSIDKSEDIIAKYHYNKQNLEEAKINKINDNEIRILYDKNKDYTSQKKSIISSTKKYEKEYNKIVNNTIKYEEKFLTTINVGINGLKEICCDISDKLKDISIVFFNSIRESFNTPLDLIDSSLKYFKETNEKEIMSNAMINTFNTECNLSFLNPEKYNLKSLEQDFEDNNERSGSFGSKGGKIKNEEDYLEHIKNGYVKFEDGFEEMNYFEDDSALETVKEMFTNFELINHNGINIEIEEEKNLTKRYTSKIIKNMSNKLKDDNIFESDEKKNLINLLSRHDNRIIFLHILNDYRSTCQYEIREKEYNLLGELFFYIINISKKENDYHCVEMVIILSKTYYKLKEKNNKIYLQNLILDNKYFKVKEFWEELLIYSISKEVLRSNKSETIVKNKENEQKLKTKNENIIFSQLLSLIDNMFDFGLDDQLIRQIIEPKIIFYKIGDNLKDTINDVIVSKIKSNKNNNKIEEDTNRER